MPVEIQGEEWSAKLTPEEYKAWIIYDESHPWLANSMSYESILAMFLSHFRRGINLNLPLK